MSGHAPTGYLVRPAVFAPIALSIGFAVIAVGYSWWFLLAVPFVWLGAICAEPNMNFAHGWLAYLAILMGFLLTVAVKPAGPPILAGTLTAFVASAFEKRVRAVPMEPGDAPHES